RSAPENSRRDRQSSVVPRARAFPLPHAPHPRQSTAPRALRLVCHRPPAPACPKCAESRATTPCCLHGPLLHRGQPRAATKSLVVPSHVLPEPDRRVVASPRCTIRQPAVRRCPRAGPPPVSRSSAISSNAHCGARWGSVQQGSATPSLSEELVKKANTRRGTLLGMKLYTCHVADADGGGKAIIVMRAPRDHAIFF